MNAGESQKEQPSILGSVSASLYVSFQVIANILSTKITVLPLLGWAVDGGTIIYPLTFTLRDFVHKTLGKKNSRKIVVLAGLVNLVMAGLFYFIGKTPSDSSWAFQQAYEQILMPVWRITAGSIVAQIISELIDTEIFSIVYKKFNDTFAVLTSNSVSLVVDSLLFCFIAFYGSLPNEIVWQIVYTNIIVKFAMSVLSVPSIKLIPRKVSEQEI